MARRTTCFASLLVSILGVCGALLLAPSPLRGQSPVQHASAPVGAPVVFREDTLLVVYTRFGPYSAQDRANAITERLSRVAEDPLARVDSLSLSAGDTSTDVVLGDKVILTITDADAAAVGMTRAALAKKVALELFGALKKGKAHTSIKSIVLGGILTLVSSVALLLLFKFLNRLFRRSFVTIRSWRSTKIKSLKIQKLEILTAERATDALLAMMRGFRIALFAILIYLCVPLVLSFFPWTRKLADSLFHYILSPLRAVGIGFVSYIPNLFYIAVIVVVTRYLLRVVHWFFLQIERGGISLPNFYPDWAIPTYKIARVMVVAFAAVIIFPYLPGSDSTAFRGVSVFLGIVFSLGSASSISNIIAGVVLTYMRAFELGDRVKIADTVGDVIEKTLLVTRLRTIKNVDVTIPNGIVLASHIINFSATAKDVGLILHATVSIGYDAPWKKVHELLIAAALQTENVVKEPAPFVFQTSLDDFYVSYEINAYTNSPHVMAKTLSDLNQNIQDKFNEAGIEITSPHFAAVRDGNRIAIPDSYLPKSYAAPGFRILPLGRGSTDGPPSPPKAE